MRTIASPRTLRRLQQLNEANLPFTAQIQSPVEGEEDEDGAAAIDWTTVLTTKCRIVPLAERETLTADQIAANADSMVILPAGTPVDWTQRIVVSGMSGGEPFTRTLNVVGVRSPKTAEAMRKVITSEARGD